MFRTAIFAATGALYLAGGLAHAQTTMSTFKLQPNPAFAACFERTAGVAPTATATLTKGPQRDTLKLVVSGLRPNLDFDMFTVERSNLDSAGKPVVGFTNFGMAWYQSDLHANANGMAQAIINTILVDQIFGFDPDVSLAPTNTFHVGFWFNNPQDAAPCGFNAAVPTPFNGEHTAGPVAMISVPNATTQLGPLCLNPNTSTTPATCNP